MIMFNIRPSIDTERVCVGDEIQQDDKTVSWSDVVRGRQVALTKSQEVNE